MVSPCCCCNRRIKMVGLRDRSYRVLIGFEVVLERVCILLEVVLGRGLILLVKVDKLTYYQVLQHMKPISMIVTYPQCGTDCVRRPRTERCGRGPLQYANLIVVPRDRSRSDFMLFLDAFSYCFKLFWDAVSYCL